jgi:hypothetical protein
VLFTVNLHGKITNDIIQSLSNAIKVRGHNATRQAKYNLNLAAKHAVIIE